MPAPRAAQFVDPTAFTNAYVGGLRPKLLGEKVFFFGGGPLWEEGKKAG
jgi:hypothetical protein